MIESTLTVRLVNNRGSTNMGGLINTTVFYNVVDCPAGCVPVTRVDPAKDQLTDKWFKEPGHNSPMLEADLYKRDGSGIYNADAMEGLPIGVQIVGKKWEEEKVVAMMRVVDKALGPRGFGPGTCPIGG